MNGLAEQGCNVDIYDPLADRDEILDYFGLELLPDTPDYVMMRSSWPSHMTFSICLSGIIRAWQRPVHGFDVKGIFPAECVDDTL